MDLKQLTAVVTVAEAGSITQAAKLLHLVQPSITRQIQLLEEEIGVALFERGRLGMTVTPAGRVMVEHARRALLELDRAKTEIRPGPAGVMGMVRIGLLESSLDLLCEPLVKTITTKFPDIDLRIATAYSGHLLCWLETGEVDLSLLYNVPADSLVVTAPLVEDELWAVGPPGAEITAGRVTCRELLAHPLILPVPGHSLRDIIDRALRDADGSGRAIEPRVVVQVNSLALQKSLVRSGRGWTVLPATSAAADVRAGDLAGAPLAEPRATRQIVLGWPKNARGGRAAEIVAAELARLVRRLVEHRRWEGVVAAP